MANKFQKFLFNLSTISPIVVFTVIVWWIQCGKAETIAKDGSPDITTKAILISILGVLGIVFSFYSVIVISMSRKKLEIVEISVNSVKSKDGWLIGVIISYILPFSCLTIKDYNVWLLSAIVAIGLLIIAFNNTIFPNLILFIGKFHFYEISNTNGGEDFLLISKRDSIKNAKTINKVITVWDYMMIEGV